jgi:small subunit ribosomal protein S3
LGQKTHPIGFRLGIIRDWHARWFAHKQKDYRNLVFEDLQIRGQIEKNYPDAGISTVDIERSDSDVTVTIHTSRPGIVIGRGGQRVDELRRNLESVMQRRARINVQEIRQPELDAFLVARNVADQLERRIAFRRAIRQTLGRTMQAGAEGIKIICSGRLGGADIARSEKAMEGRVPLHTLRADIDYGLAEAATEFGRIGVKVWIYKGDILPEAPPEPEIEEDISPIEVTLTANPDPVPEAVSPDPSEASVQPVEASVQSEPVATPPVEAPVQPEPAVETPVEAPVQPEAVVAEPVGEVAEEPKVEEPVTEVASAAVTSDTEQVAPTDEVVQKAEPEQGAEDAPTQQS